MKINTIISYISLNKTWASKKITIMKKQFLISNPQILTFKIKWLVCDIGELNCIRLIFKLLWVHQF